MKLDLPQVFVSNVTQVSCPEGRQWLADLPGLLDEAAQRWNLTVGAPFPLSYNYVCAATRHSAQTGSDRQVVLKIGLPNRELTSEINALAVYAGQGACRLLEADAGRGMLLLERLQPGTMLVALKDDDQATEVAAELMQVIQRPAPQGKDFISLRGWFDGLRGLRPRFGGGTGPFPKKTVGIVEGLLRELFEEDRPQVLLHGDFHHFNILLSERGWQVIDPKGVIGPAEYEVGPLLINPVFVLPEPAEAVRRSERRIAILSERTGFEPQRIWRWAVCHSLLSSWWDVTEDGSGGEYSRAWTEIFLKMAVN